MGYLPCEGRLTENERRSFRREIVEKGRRFLFVTFIFKGNIIEYISIK